MVRGVSDSICALRFRVPSAGKRREIGAAVEEFLQQESRQRDGVRPARHGDKPFGGNRLGCGFRPALAGRLQFVGREVVFAPAVRGGHRN